MVVDLGKKSGAISLEKGQAVTIEKTPKITATVSFSSSTDYDIYAIVLLKDGTELVCSTFGSETQRNPTPEVEGVRHLGDVARGGSGSNVETLEITLTPNVDQVAVVAYSAQSNGTGSFAKYGVTTTVDNHSGTVITVDAKDANANDTIYTCVPAIIRNGEDGVQIEQVELYSKPRSERRPTFEKPKGGFFKKADSSAPAELVMDAGSTNLYK